MVCIYQGAEHETRYERTAPGADTLIPVSEESLRAGSVTVVPPEAQDIYPWRIESGPDARD